MGTSKTLLATDRVHYHNKTRQSMFVKHVPPLWAYFIEATKYCKANISRALTPATLNFDEHELSPHMHF